jgi:hypothetical protein
MQCLDLTRGTIEFLSDHKGDLGPIELSSHQYSNPEFTYSFGIDKGGWDFAVDFSGTVDGDNLEGFYYPTELPVRGKRVGDT